MADGDRRFLLCRVGEVLCALSLADVEETMRPLRAEAVAGMPAFVRGVAMVRGMPIPVVDAAALLFSGAESPAARFVTLKVGSRRVALSVGAVLGIVDIPNESVDTLPPLLREAGDDVIASIGALDTDLLFVLSATKIVTEEVRALAERQSRVSA